MSGFWSNHIELYEDIIIEEMVKRGLAIENEEPEIVLKRWEERKDMHTIAQEAEMNYWSSRIDDTIERMKGYEIGNKHGS